MKTPLSEILRRLDYAKAHPRGPYPYTEYYAQDVEELLRAVLESGTTYMETVEGCPCYSCKPPNQKFTTFTVCVECGNKRCPHATHHSFPCTHSNEPGQLGSRYS